MSKQFREYIEGKLAAVEKEAARLRTAIEVLEDFDADRPAPAQAEKPDPVKKAAKKNGAAPPAGTRSKAGKKECTTKGCSNVVVAKGLCRKHYDQANPRPARSRKNKSKEEIAESGKAMVQELGANLKEDAPDPRLREGRVMCDHPRCIETTADTGVEGPHYCSDFCRNNHAKLVAEGSM